MDMAEVVETWCFLSSAGTHGWYEACLAYLRAQGFTDSEIEQGWQDARVIRFGFHDD